VDSVLGLSIPPERAARRRYMWKRNDATRYQNKVTWYAAKSDQLQKRKVGEVEREKQRKK
jgi:hypothetical protein